MTVLRTQLRGVGRRPSRLLLPGLAVLVAAFFAFATVLAHQITERTVLASLSGTPAATSVVVQIPESVREQQGPAGAGALSPALLDTVRRLPGVAEAVGRLDGAAVIGGRLDGTLVTVKADPGAGPLSTVRLVSGSYPTRPGQIAATSRTAGRMGLQPGTRVRLLPGQGGATTLAVTGVVQPSDDDGASLYAPDALTAAVLKSKYTRIDLRAVPGTSDATLTQTVAAAVRPAGGGLEVVGGAGVRADEAKQTLEQVDLIFALLTTFVVIAVVAAGLVASSTFRIVFAQRMRQLALLRAIGAGRGRLAAALAVEGALTGLVAGALGVAAALGLGQALPPVARWFGVELATPGYQLGAALAIVAGTVAVTAAAVLAPAFAAAKVSPLEALRTSATAEGREGISKPRLALGALLAAAAAATAALVLSAAPKPGDQTSGDSTLGLLLLIALSGTIAFLALLALGPVLLRPILRLLGRPLGWTGPVGRLAVAGVGGAPRRAAAVSAVVALGVTLITGVLVTSTSLRRLADSEMAGQFLADIQVSTAERTPLPAGFVDGLRRRGEVTHVLPYQKARATVRGVGAPMEMDVAGVDVRALPAAAKLRVSSGSLADMGPGRAVLAETIADSVGVRVGDRVDVTVGSARAGLQVVAVLPGSGPLNSLLVTDPADLSRLGVAPSGVLLDVTGEGEQATTDAQAAIRAQPAPPGGVQIEALADQRDEINTWLTGLTAIAVGLLGLTVLIAVVGVGTTTALSVVERTRESGLLRAIGLSRSGLRTSLTTEAGLYGLIGSALGLALGVPYAWLAVLTLGVDAPLQLPLGQLAAVVMALAGLTALAGLLPARRASAVSPVTALGHE